MEIVFENKSVNAYRELTRQVKRVQESAEAVVPDTYDDIGRIASVQSSVLLKSKDLTPGGVTVTGEASAVLLYITESEDSVAFVRLSKSFEMEYEIAGLDDSAAAHISLAVTNTEARVLNPRKVSVTMELTGELSCYMPAAVEVETLLPENSGRGLHVKMDTAEAVLVNAVCEKTFAFNEQYSFPAGKPAPERLVSQSVDIRVADTQNIGGKVILKGSVNVAVCYLSQDANYPLQAQFSSPFSQIIETGQEDMDSCSVLIELSSTYYDLIDTINGEKAMDTELHAVIQVVSRKRQSMSYVADAYSSLMPARCSTKSAQINTASEAQRSRLSADERVNIADDCEDVLCVFTSLQQVTAAQGRLSAAAALDVVYRTAGGQLASAKRLVNMEGDCAQTPARIIDSRISDIYLRPDGSAIDCRITAECLCQSSTAAELIQVDAVELIQEAAYDSAGFPAVTLVRVADESLWELAKKYRSSVESIEAVNDMSGGVRDRLLLVPREK